jgi:tetratricopeptide (TPR) repeat protein
MISGRLVFLHLVLLAFIIGVTFFNAFHSSFKMDDHDFFKDPKIRNPEYLIYNWIPESDRYLHLSKASQESSYRPVTNTVLAFLYHKFSDHIQAYHVVNIILFFIGCSFLYWFVLSLCGDAVLAFLTAVLFAVHPINGLAVNYIVASAYAYQLIFAMLSMIFFVRSYQKEKYIFAGVLSLLFFLISLGVHETSMIIPLYMLGIVWYINRESWISGLRRVSPFFVVLAVYIFFRMKYASLKTGVLEKYFDFHMSIVQYLASFIKLISWYLSQLIVPDGIVLMWSTKVVSDDRWGWIVVGIGLVSVSFWFIRRSGRSIQSLALILFMTGLLPILGACLFRPTTGLIMEPHWMFFPAIGFFIVLAWILVRLIRWNQWIGLILCVCLLLGLVRISHLYNDIWSSDQTYCYYWREKAPAFKTTEFFLAYALIKDKQYDQARKFLLDAREGIFSDWQIYANLGVMDFEERNYDSAIGNYQKALSFNPSAPEVYNNLGLIYEYTGHLDQAIEAHRKVIELNRFLLEPRLNLARIALSQGDFKTAVELYAENLKIAPYERRSFELLVAAYLDADHLDEAQAMIHDLGVHSRDAVMLTEVGNLAAEKKKNVWALDLYMQALRIDPGYKGVYVQAGVLLANLNQLDRAIQMWEQAITIDPADAQVLGLIKKAREMKEIQGNDTASHNKNLVN